MVTYSGMRTRNMSLSVLLTALALVASACGSSAESVSGEPNDEAPVSITDADCVESTDTSVTIYSGRTENLIQPILDGFECETGIEAKVRWGDSTDLAVLLAEEGDATDADVFLSSSPGPVGFLDGNGLLGQIDDDTLALVDENNRAQSGSWVGFSGRKRVLVYNTENVSDDELPTSVFALTDAIYEGRVAIPASNGSFEDWFTVFRDQEGSDVAEAWLGDMTANNARPYANNRSIVEAVGRGEIDMGLVNHYYNYQEAAARGDEHKASNYDFAPDDIGSLLIITAATVTASTDSPSEANALIEYLLSENAQRYFTEETFEYPLAAGVAPVDILPPLSALEIGAVDFESLGGGFEETERIVQESGILNN